MIKTISIDMSTCDEDFGNRIFGKVIEQEGDNLICEFDSANYDFKQEKVIKQLKEKLNIAIDALHKIATQASIWEPVSNLKSGVSKIGTLRDVANMALKQIGEINNEWLPLEKLDNLDLRPVKEFIQEVECGGFIDDDGCGMPVIETLSGRFLYKNEGIYPSEVLEGKKLDCDYVAWFNK